MEDGLYLYAKKDWESEDLWYTKRKLGRHAIESVPKKLMSAIGVEGKFTLHSLRATTATRLYNNHIDEQCIKEVNQNVHILGHHLNASIPFMCMQITGHSSECVREYKETGLAMKRKCSEILALGKSEETKCEVGREGILAR